MISFLKSLFGLPKPWQKEIQELHANLVPISGEADSLQGELVRSVQNLADECYRNGWMNWDVGNEDEIEILRRYLPDSSIFSEAERNLIQSNLDRIEWAGTKGADQGELAYEEIKYVAEKVVVWCRHKKNPILKAPDENWLEYKT